MLDNLYTQPGAAQRLRSSPLGPWLDSFVDRLTELGYTPWSRRSNVVLAADLGRWMAKRDILKFEGFRDNRKFGKGRNSPFEECLRGTLQPRSQFNTQPLP